MAQRPHVYVFEHDPTLSGLLVEILTGEGYPVSRFSTAAVAPDRVRDDGPCLAIVDFPPDGAARQQSIRLISVLRKAASTRRLPVIGITGDFELLRRASTRFADLVDFAILAKPFGLDELLDLVTAMLDYVAHDEPAAFLRADPAVLLADADGRHRHANQKALALLGYSLPQLRRLRVTDVLAGPERAAQQEWSRFVRERSWSTDKVLLRRKDGEEVSVQLHASVVQGAAQTDPICVAWMRP